MRVIDLKKTGEVMKEAIDGKGMTITQVSESLGISYYAVSKWVNGITFPDANNLFRLAHILDVRADELVVLNMEYFSAHGLKDVGAF